MSFMDYRGMPCSIGSKGQFKIKVPFYENYTYISSKTFCLVCTGNNNIIAPSQTRHIDPKMKDTKVLQKLINVFPNLAFVGWHPILSPLWVFL